MTCRVNPALTPKIFRQIGELADEMGLRIYVVGGYVRDHYLRRPSTDIDEIGRASWRERVCLYV